MRFVIDAQGMQTASKTRGIGRYVRGLVRGLLRNREEHEIFLIVNGDEQATAFAIQNYFKEYVGYDHIIMWHAPAPLAYTSINSEINRFDAEIIYQYTILQYKPDVFIAGSLFEGLGDEYALSADIISQYCVTGCIVYDFIPADHPGEYLANPIIKSWYRRCYDKMKYFDILYAISDFTAARASEKFPQKTVVNIMSGCDECFTPSPPEKKANVVSEYGIVSPYIFYAGGVEERKNIPALIRAYAALDESIRKSHQLVIACGRHDDIRQQLQHKKTEAGLSDAECVLLGYIGDDALAALYSSCKLFVFPSRYEGFGLPVLEAMNCGAPVICADNTSLPEVIGLKEAMFDAESVSSIRDKICEALVDDTFYSRLAAHCREQCRNFSWDISASRVLDFDYSQCPRRSKMTDVSAEAIVRLAAGKILAQKHSDQQLRLLAVTMAKSFLQKKRRLFVDISILQKFDAGTGIQRVTKNVVFNLLKAPPSEYDVVPVYLDAGQWRMANAYLLNYGFSSPEETDYVVAPRAGDIMLCPELNQDDAHIKSGLMQKLCSNGCRIYTIIFDLIPVRHPHYCSDGIVKRFAGYLKSISSLSGIIAISKSVAEEYKEWRKNNITDSDENFLIDWFHLGADMENNAATRGIPDDAEKVFAAMTVRPTLLQVSTIEPRKGYAQALKAFELLWASGVDVNFIIVGKAGWKVESLIKKIESHPEKGRRLFWLQGISDEYLDKIYAKSSGVLFVSEAEGFGLAVIEGAQRGKPLILRDIPVFREIAGEHATYFNGLDETPLADCIKKWLADYKEGKSIPSGGIRPLSWAESVRILVSKLPL